MKSFFKKSPQLSAPEVEDALRRITDPASGKDILSAGLVSGLAVREGKVGFVLTVPREEVARYEALADRCHAAVMALPGARSVTPVLTAETASPPPPSSPPRSRAAQWNLTPVEGVMRIIAVASGKGGVGKSTTTVQLARALAAQGKRVGIVDADIYGSSIPRMLKLSGKPEVADAFFVPLESRGIKAMSMGFIVGEEAAIMRGPMVTKSLVQMLRGTAWGELDVLLVDMPPGTGDVHLSMVQSVPLAYGGGGAIIVTTPQEVALDDARKAASMFAKVHVPILGVIENMSYFIDPTGASHRLFGEGGGKKLAGELGVPLLGEVPLLPEIQKAGDSGDAYNAPEFQPIAAALARPLATES